MQDMSLPSSPGSEDFAAFLDAELQSETNSDSEGYIRSDDSDRDQTMYENFHLVSVII
jgi:hypothetical protein